MALDRETLFAEVWADPMRVVAARYEVSGSYLARVCERMGVPRPPRGYWAKVRHGKAPPQPALPEAGPEHELSWEPGTSWPQRTRPARVVVPTGEVPRARRRRTKDRPTAHALLEGARGYFEKVRPDTYDDNPLLRPYKQSMLDVVASREGLEEALSLANELYLSLEDRGYRVVLAAATSQLHCPTVEVREEGGREGFGPSVWRPYRATVALVGDVAVALSVFEMTESVEVVQQGGAWVPVQKARRSAPHRWTTTKDLPSGRYVIQAASPYPGTEWSAVWRESTPGTLAKRIPAIVRELANAAPVIAAQAQEAQVRFAEEQKRWEEKRRVWAEEEAVRARERARTEAQEELLELIEGWALARRLESFFEEVQGASEGLEASERAGVLERLETARELFGGPEAVRWFHKWRTPRERERT